MQRIKAFISCAEEDKKVAKQIKEKLESYFGFDVFLFSHDVLLSQEWEKQIMEGLSMADFFIPLISKHFENSAFSNQEAGIALASRKKVLPIRLDSTKPSGFLQKYQGKLLDHGDYDPAYKIAMVIFFLSLKDDDYKEFRNRVRESIVYALLASNDFRITRTIAKVMRYVEGLTKTQLRTIVKAAKENRCVRDEKFGLPEFKKHLKEKYGISL